MLWLEVQIITVNIKEITHELIYTMRCAIWYSLYHLKNVKNSQGGVWMCLTGVKSVEYTNKLLE